MNYTKIQRLAGLLMAGACFISAGSSRSAELWLHTGLVTNTMPDGQAIVFWAFGTNSANWATPGPLTVPGPKLSVVAGDSLVLHVTNALPEPVSMVIPGQYGFDTQAPAFFPSTDPVYPNRVRSLNHEAPTNGVATFTWTNVQSGTFLYHSGSHLSIQVQMGLYGALAVVGPGPSVYPGVAYNSEATLLLSEVDANLHAAVAGTNFGAGPNFFQTDFTNPAAFITAVRSSPNLVARWVYTNISGDPTMLAADLNSALTPFSIYNPTLFPDRILEPLTLSLMRPYAKLIQDFTLTPTGHQFKGNLMRMNRMMLYDGLTNAGIYIPPPKLMSSAGKAKSQYFMINGQPYTNGQPAIVAGAAGSTNLLRLLNAGMDLRTPTLNNGGDLVLVGEDGQQAPYPRRSAVVLLPALKTVDALWTPPAAGSYAVYERHLGLVSGATNFGGALTFLSTGAAGTPAPVSVLVPPASQMAFVGQSATFSVVSTHTGTPTYQWQQNGSPITGATASTYTIAAVTAASLGTYTVVVTDGAQSATSAGATLTVLTQPTPVTVADGAAATFSTTDLGPVATLTYQWQKDGIAISGATASSYTFNANYATDNGHLYSVVATASTISATSAGTLLTVTPGATVITGQPANQVVPDFGTATFSVTATGSGLTYQWQRAATAAGPFANVAGATSSSYSFTAHYATDNGAVFQVVVTGATGPAVTSTTATLTVTPIGPLIITQPVNTVANFGQPAQLTVVAEATGALSYQWQHAAAVAGPYANVANAGGITGATLASLAFNGTATANTANNGFYQVIVTSGAPGAGSVTSTAASFTISNTPPTILTQPVSLAVNAGVASVSFTVVAFGFPTPTYQWQRFNGTAWVNLLNAGYSGVTTPTLTIRPGPLNITVVDAGSYRVVISNSLGARVVSAVAKLTVTQTFAGATAVSIPADASGTATPYPARTAQVPAFRGASIQHASVTLTLTDPAPFDADMLLSTPAGARSVHFMAGVGPPPSVGVELPPIGPTYFFYGVTNCVLTFDDSAPAPVSINYWLAAGTYKPTVFPMGTNWMTLPLLGFPVTPGGVHNTFSSLNNFVPGAGLWQLLVNDNASDIAAVLPAGQTTGTISSWGLTLTVGPGSAVLPAIALAPLATPPDAAVAASGQ